MHRAWTYLAHFCHMLRRRITLVLGKAVFGIERIERETLAVTRDLGKDGSRRYRGAFRIAADYRDHRQRKILCAVAWLSS